MLNKNIRELTISVVSTIAEIGVPAITNVQIIN